MPRELTAPQRGVLTDKRQSREWSGREFVNAQTTEVSGAGAMLTVAKKYFTRPDGAGKPAGAIPVQKLTRASWPARADADLAITWLGHAGFVIEIEGMFVMVDPMMGPNPSPVYGTGPGRLHEPPCTPAELPDADVVIFSHDHYDHLDKRTVRALADKVKLFVVPIGVGHWLRKFGVTLNNIVEMDWGQHYQVGTITINCLPARHFSGRGLTDRNKSLWASYAIVGSQRRVYFGGDSGEQNEAYAAIGEAFGPFDASLIPIGAYDPLWHDIHINPEEAVEAYTRLDGGLFIPCHWATFDLAVHGWANPALRLSDLVAKNQLPISWPLPGQRFKLSKAPKVEWWRSLVTENNSGE